MKTVRRTMGCASPVWPVCLALATLATAPANAAESKEATRRAALYQVETRGVLSDNHWHIVRDQPGKLVADHAMGLAGPLDPAIRAVVTQEFPSTGRLLIKFAPVSEHRTNCTVSGEMYYFRHEANSSKVNRTRSGPYPMRDEESARTIKNLLAQAEKRLAKKHPELAPQ